jgi:hypothetical protein
MTYRPNPFLTFGCALAGLLLLAAGVALSWQSAHAESSVMRVDPVSQTVDVSSGKFTVNILGDNVTNLGAYEFELKFDPDVLRFVGVEDSGFLGSSGREVHCPGGTLEQSVDGGPVDRLKFACATTNPSPPGPDGSGTLATMTFAPRKAGHSPLTLIASSSSTGTADVAGDDMHPTSSGGDVTVVGEGPAATPEPNEPTPLPTRQYVAPVQSTPTPGGDWMLTPEPGQTPMSRPMPGREMTRPSADGLAAASADSSGSSGNNRGSPIAGTGPERETSRWPILTGLLFMGGGVLLLCFAAYTRRDRKYGTG